MHPTRIKTGCKRVHRNQPLQTNFEAHTPAGLPTRISDPEGRKTNLSYTSAGQLQTISNLVTTALGKTWNLKKAGSGLAKSHSGTVKPDISH